MKPITLEHSLCKQRVGVRVTSGALDVEMIKEVLEATTQLAISGRTMICVTHEKGVARRMVYIRVKMTESNESWRDTYESDCIHQIWSAGCSSTQRS
jgi:ABC-type polar amino acid transport system ATPase subunit